MMIFSYVPSADPTATVLARPDLVLLTTAAASRLDALWLALDGGADAAAMLDALTAGGISSTPDFVLVSGLGTASSVVMARGAFSAVVLQGSQSQPVDGSGVSSWVETRLEGVTGVRLGSAPDDARHLPLARGAAPAAAVLWGEQDAAAQLATPPAAASAEPIAPPSSLVPPTEATDPAPAAPAPVVPAPAAPASVVVPAPAPAAASEPPSAPAEATLGAAALTISPPPEVDDEPEPEPGASGYDHLFGATVMRSVEEAAVRVDDEPEAQNEIGDRTVVVADIAALRAQRRAERGRTPAVPPAPRFAIELPSGERELLDQSIIFGRAPSASRVSGSAVPRLVTLTTPNQDISRSHVQVSVEGDTVVVTDLHSMNGTLVTVPGRNPQRLREGEPTTVITGTVLDLGDGATLVVREL